jgi:hypothetical protein
MHRIPRAFIVGLALVGASSCGFSEPAADGAVGRYTLVEVNGMQPPVGLGRSMRVSSGTLDLNERAQYAMTLDLGRDKLTDRGTYSAGAALIVFKSSRRNAPALTGSARRRRGSIQASLPITGSRSVQLTFRRID